MITEQQYINSAQYLNCDSAAVKAVTEVESGHKGFYGNGNIILKFEGHIFHQYTHGKFDQSHPRLSYPAWTEKYSEYGESAYNRFNEAFALDKNAAMLATSWGMYQIMGEHYSECGFKSVGEFVDFLKQSEGNQLTAFCSFAKSQKLTRYLNPFSPDDFAYHYNGARYKDNDYGNKLRAAYQKFKKS